MIALVFQRARIINVKVCQCHFLHIATAAHDIHTVGIYFKHSFVFWCECHHRIRADTQILFVHPVGVFEYSPFRQLDFQRGETIRYNCNCQCIFIISFPLYGHNADIFFVYCILKINLIIRKGFTEFIISLF